MLHLQRLSLFILILQFLASCSGCGLQKLDEVKPPSVDHIDIALQNGEVITIFSKGEAEENRPPCFSANSMTVRIVFDTPMDTATSDLSVTVIYLVSSDTASVPNIAKITGGWVSEKKWEGEYNVPEEEKIEKLFTIEVSGGRSDSNLEMEDCKSPCFVIDTKPPFYYPPSVERIDITSQNAQVITMFSKSKKEITLTCIPDHSMNFTITFDMPMNATCSLSVALTSVASLADPTSVPNTVEGHWVSKEKWEGRYGIPADKKIEQLFMIEVSRGRSLSGLNMTHHKHRFIIDTIPPDLEILESKLPKSKDDENKPEVRVGQEIVVVATDILPCPEINIYFNRCKKLSNVTAVPDNPGTRMRTIAKYELSTEDMRTGAPGEHGLLEHEIWAMAQDVAGNEPLAASSMGVYSSPVVSIEAPKEVKPSEKFVAEIVVDQIYDLHSADFIISADPSGVLKFLDAEAGSLTTNAEVFCEIDSMKDEAQVKLNMQTGQGVRGFGSIAKLNLEVGGSPGAMCILGLSRIKLVDTESDSMWVRSLTISLTITGG